MTIFIPRWVIWLAVVAAGVAAFYGGIIPLIEIARWCGPHGCS